MTIASQEIVMQMVARAKLASFRKAGDDGMREAIRAAFRALDSADLSDLPGYTEGLWSRRNLEAIIDDLELR